MADTLITNLGGAASDDPALTGDEIPINRVSGGPLDRKVTAGSVMSLIGDKVGPGSGRLQNVITYTTTGNTWTKPSGLRFVIVEVQGAGGGGAGATAAIGAGGSGGGGGGWARKKIAAASLGASETVTVGTGGAAGASGGGVGGAGGASSFGTHLGGCGGEAGLTGELHAGRAGGAGGAATGGDLLIAGLQGCNSMRTGTAVSGAGATGFGMAGFGGASRLGNGGRAAGSVQLVGAAINGTVGTGFGGGGGGGSGFTSTGALGGAGAGGAVIVWEYL